MGTMFSAHSAKFQDVFLDMDFMYFIQNLCDISRDCISVVDNVYIYILD